MRNGDGMPKSASFCRTRLVPYIRVQNQRFTILETNFFELRNADRQILRLLNYEMFGQNAGRLNRLAIK